MSNSSTFLRRDESQKILHTVQSQNSEIGTSLRTASCPASEHLQFEIIVGKLQIKAYIFIYLFFTCSDSLNVCCCLLSSHLYRSRDFRSKFTQNIKNMRAREVFDTAVRDADNITYTIVSAAYKNVLKVLTTQRYRSERVISSVVPSPSFWLIKLC